MPRSSYTIEVLHLVVLIILILSSEHISGQTVTSSDSLMSNVTDSTAVDSANTDSIPQSSSALESKVHYVGRDSMRMDVKEQKVRLYGDAKVVYEDMTLTAGFIEFNLKTNEVYATPFPDTSGEMVNEPHFSDGEQEFDAGAMRYNFKSKKGLIMQAVTKQDEGFVKGEKIKKHGDDVIFIEDGKFCPCEDPNAKTFIKAKRLKLIQNDKIVTGPANLRIANIPTPLVVPFGIFPNTKERASGLVVPEYGSSPGLGFFLQSGGYYWAASDHIDLQLTGSIYSRGSYGFSAKSNYAWRYKNNGNIGFDYTKIISGFKEAPSTYSVSDNVWIEWRHTQDQKAHPFGSFSADVNAGSQNNFQNTINTSSQNYLSTNFKSNVNYSYRIPNSPLSFTVNASHEQNRRDSTVSITLPQTTFTMSRIFPFKRQKAIGEEKWFEKIGLTYSNNFYNSVRTKEDELFDPTTMDKLQYGVAHNAALSANYKVLNYLTLTPNIRATEMWSFKTVNAEWDNANSTVVRDTVNEFRRFENISMGADVTTNIYGFYNFLRGPLKALRHEMIPSVGFTYRPNYSYRNIRPEIQIDTNGRTQAQNELLMAPGAINSGVNTSEGSGFLTFSINNNLGAKYTSKKDTTGEDKKVDIIDQLSFSSSYDIFADSLNLAPIRMNFVTQLLNFFDVNIRGTLDPYAYDSLLNGDRYQYYTSNQFELSKSGNLGRITQSSVSVGFSLNNKERQKLRNKYDVRSPYDPIYMNMPWDVNITYNLSYNNPNIKANKQISQVVNVRGNINLTKYWDISASTNLDIETLELGYTQLRVYRDLNCWELNFSIVPFGPRKNYSFGLNLKPQMLKDLKLERQRNWIDLQN